MGLLRAAHNHAFHHKNTLPYQRCAVGHMYQIGRSDTATCCTAVPSCCTAVQQYRHQHPCRSLLPTAGNQSHGIFFTSFSSTAPDEQVRCSTALPMTWQGLGVPKWNTSLLTLWRPTFAGSIRGAPGHSTSKIGNALHIPPYSMQTCTTPARCACLTSVSARIWLDARARARALLS
jgi:hypothetical protein